MKNYFYISLLTALMMFSCSKQGKTLKLLKVTEYSSSKVTDTSLARILKVKNNLDIDIDYTVSPDYALEQLKEKKVDLVILPNNVSSEHLNFRTIVPLLPRVIVILTNKEVGVMSARDLLEKGTVYFEDRSRLDSLLFEKIYYNFNVDKTKIKAKLSEELDLDKPSDSLKIYVGLIHLNNPLVKKLAKANWHFFSMGDVDYYGKGSMIEGFTMMNASAYPLIIPMSVYTGKPKRSLLTIAINDVLICREDLDESIVYEITQTIIENKAQLAEMNPVYNLLNFDYDSHVLSYPKHEGTQKFLNRDELPVWYKYVRMIWPLISISVVVFGVFASLRQRLKRRKKQNIEMYYNNLLEIRDKAEVAVDIDTFVNILKELKLLRSQAMKSLANKKLDPGESFNIFLALYKEVRSELTENIRDLRNKEKTV